MMHQKQQEEDPLSLPEDKLDEKHLVLVAKNTRLKQREHEAREGASEEEEDSRRSVEDDCLPQDNSRTRVDSVPLSTSTPFPRAEMHIKKIRSPDHFRTQYLSNLGIWADNQAKKLTSAPRTEARYGRNVGAGGEGPGVDEIAPENEPPLLIPPRPPASEASAKGAAPGGGGGAAAAAADAALAPLEQQQQQQRRGGEQTTQPVLGEGNERRDGGTWEEGRSAGLSGDGRGSNGLPLPPPPSPPRSLPRPRAGAAGGQEGMPGAATGAAGGGGRGEITSTGAAVATCLAVADLSLAAAASFAASAVATDGVEVEEQVGGACSVPETEQGRDGALSSAAVPGMGGVAAGDGSDVELSTAGLEKKIECVSSRTAVVGARMEARAAAAPAAADAVATESTTKLEAAGTGSTATAQRPAANEADLSIEPSAAIAAEAATAAAIAAPTPATTDAPKSPGSSGNATVASALRAGPRDTRFPSISSDGISLDGSRPAVEAAASPSSARSSGIVTRTIANPVAPGSPPLRAVKPPRRDIRKDYLTNLGMKGAVVAGPGGTRTPPPMVRRSSFIESVERPVEEQLKDPNAGDITLEDVLRVVGSLLTGGGGKVETEPRQCPSCARQKTLRGSPPPAGRRNECEDGANSRSRGGGGWGGRGSKAEADEGGVVGAGALCGHKHVDFAPLVSAVYIPVHTEYSDRVRRSYWNSAGEIREMVYRNMIEFDAEDYNWEKVAEEEEMYFCEETGEFIHPIFFDSHEEAREVRANSTDAEAHVEYINEGRKMPVMQRR